VIPATLVTGATAAAREAAVAADIAMSAPAAPIAIILEGLPAGDSALNAPPDNFPSLHLARIAPGCLCCTGNLILRVTLNRLLRLRPARCYITLANAQHVERLRVFLSQTPYDKLLHLTKDLSV
jgi:hypothetical protein